MTKPSLHDQDHIALFDALDCSQKVAGLEKDIALLNLRIEEAKDDKEKAGTRTMWFAGMAFSIIMAVAGSLINSNATISVLQEKVQEQKSEIEKLNKYISDVHENLTYRLDEHNH